MHVVQAYAYTIIIRKPGTVAIWVYIVSALTGFLTLIIMTYGLYKVSVGFRYKVIKYKIFIYCFQIGFFRRAKKEELKVLVRQSQIEVKQTPKVDEEYY